MAKKKPTYGGLDKLKPPAKPKSNPGILKRPTRTSAVYTVKRGDTLSSIAKRNGTSLSALLKANPSLRSNPKYQGGNRIFSGTKVRLK